MHLEGILLFSAIFMSKRYLFSVSFKKKKNLLTRRGTS